MKIFNKRRLLLAVTIALFSVMTFSYAKNDLKEEKSWLKIIQS